MSDKSNNLIEKKREVAELARRLPKLYRVAYSVSCCERLFPYYAAFSQMSKRSKGHAVRLRKIIDELWSVLELDEFSDNRIREYESAIDKFAGDLDGENRIAFARAALSTLSAVECSLRVVQDESGEAVEDMVEHSMNAIENYLYEVTCPWVEHPTQAEYDAFSDWLLESEMMGMELKKHQADLRSLKAQERLTSSFIDEFRKRTKTVSLFPIGAGMFSA